ncbi:unnamed protein product [Durusdinium trenchii]
MKEPLMRSDRLGDGAYQLSWHPSCPGTVAVAAMRCGFPIFRVEDSMHMLGGYCQGAEEGSHGSLGYGISWQFGQGGRVASASFYDNSIHIWRAVQSAESAEFVEKSE